MQQSGGPLDIEDYGLIGDCATAALVGRNGRVDWLCLPRFDSDACFAALLGDSRHGSWLLAPAAGGMGRRRYRPGTMILETVFETRTGSAAVIDFMVPDAPNPTLVRIVEGRSGTVSMQTDLAFRFEYGRTVPWVTRLEGGRGICAIAGPDQVVLRSGVRLHGEDFRHRAQFHVGASHRVAFVLRHAPSHEPVPSPLDAEDALRHTEETWRAWSSRCTYKGGWGEPVQRSLLTLKALSYAATGGIAAAPTTSLPECLGGTRNWDYRYCWLRDATLTLLALMHAGYTEEASRWRDWLQRSVAGMPSQIQILYGMAGERRLPEWEPDWLPGYQGAAPVRIGNAAAGQVQLDVFGEVLDCLHQARQNGLRPVPHGWDLQRGIIAHLAEIWDQPDEGMWEVRSGPQHFTFSKIMAWVAVDRMIRDARRYRLAGPMGEWEALRQEIFDTVCREGFDERKGSFVQHFGTRELDASLLLIPSVGFLPADDQRVRGTVAAIERELVEDGFVLRYRTGRARDGLPPGEGAFLACTFWLADAYCLQGRRREARQTFERLLDLRNDLGLLSEEYDPKARRLVGNFPQAFSHLALVASAMNLSNHGPALRRSNGGGDGEGGGNRDR